MIIVTRLSGQKMAVNPDLIERIESTPDTILVMADGSRYLVAETMEETADLVRDYRASIIARALDYSSPDPQGRRQDALRLVAVTPAPPEEEG